MKLHLYIFNFKDLIHMRKFIQSVLLFIPFCIAFYLIFVVLWGELLPVQCHTNIKYKKGSYGHLYSRVNEIEKFKSVDILFLGSSVAYRGFDVRMYEQLGLRAFNLGSSGQSPIETLTLLHRYLEDLNPKMVIYAAPIFYTDGVESSLDLISNDKKDSLTLQMMLRLKNLKVINTSIYGFYRSFFNRDAGFKEALKTGKDTYIPGGFVESEISYYNKSADQYETPENANYYVYDYQKDSFEQIMAELHSRGIRVVLVNPPITKEHYFIDEGYAKYMRGCAEFLDYSTLFHFNDSLYFNDAVHLNQNGVKVFNEKIIEALKLDGNVSAE